VNLRIISPLLIFLALASSLPALADEENEGFFLLPNAAVGFNSVQGTYFRLGLDVGYRLSANYYFGAGAYYAAGNQPEHDRELGAGPFVGAVYALTRNLSFHLREDIDYVDERNPVLVSTNPDTYTHKNAFGLESATYAGIHFWFTRGFGVSAGYRLVLGLNNSDLADGRSGTVLGLTIGI
jgi:hypothetical protein